MRIRNLKLIGAVCISAHSIVVAVCSKINGDNFSFHAFQILLWDYLFIAPLFIFFYSVKSNTPINNIFYCSELIWCKFS